MNTHVLTFFLLFDVAQVLACFRYTWTVKCSTGSHLASAIMFASDEVDEVEGYLAVEIDKDFDELLVDHYVARSDHLAEEASKRLRSRSNFENCNCTKVLELVRFEKKDGYRFSPIYLPIYFSLLTDSRSGPA